MRTTNHSMSFTVVLIKGTKVTFLNKSPFLPALVEQYYIVSTRGNGCHNRLIVQRLSLSLPVLSASISRLHIEDTSEAMSSLSPISRPLLAATLISLLFGSTHGGNLAETVEFREYIYEGLRNVRWDGSKTVGDLYISMLSLAMIWWPIILRNLARCSVIKPKYLCIAKSLVGKLESPASLH